MTSSSSTFVYCCVFAAVFAVGCVSADEQLPATPSARAILPEDFATHDAGRRRIPGPYQIDTTGFPTYGDVSGIHDFPNAFERMQLCWFNYVRMDPQKFKDLMVCNDGTRNCLSTTLTVGGIFPPNNGVWWDLNLNRAARAHNQDLLDNGCGLSHNDCNGTDTFTRIRKFADYGNSEILWNYGGFGSTLPKKLLAPWAMVSGWICDASMYGSGSLATCCADGAACDGHRQSIMTGSRRVGCGLTFGADGTTPNTCNQGSGTSPYASKNIKSASHVFAYPSGNNMNMRYMLNWWSEAPGNPAPTSVRVFVNNNPITMSIEAMGTYSTAPTSVAIGTGVGCSEYYFLADGERYPQAGYYKTYGMGTCLQHWSATSSLSTATVATVATVSSVAATTATTTTTTTAATVATTTTAATVATTTTAATVATTTTAATTTVTTATVSTVAATITTGVACVPITACPSPNTLCGNYPDGCGGTVDCMGCPGAQDICNGQGQCVCQPSTCATLGFNCQTAPNGCAGTLNCGMCSGTDVCTNNQCTPAACGAPTQTCAQAGKDCGIHETTCSGNGNALNLTCGACSNGEQCLAGVCTCPDSCGSLGATCGSAIACGKAIPCGACTPGVPCLTTNVCYDPCNGVTCGLNQQCIGGACNCADGFSLDQTGACSKDNASNQETDSASRNVAGSLLAVFIALIVAWF